MGILSDKSFAGLAPSVSDASLQGVADMGFTTMTEIQAATIPHLMEGSMTNPFVPVLVAMPCRCLLVAGRRQCGTPPVPR